MKCETTGTCVIKFAKKQTFWLSIGEVLNILKIFMVVADLQTYKTDFYVLLTVHFSNI